MKFTSGVQSEGHHANGSAKVTSFSASDTCDRIKVERYKTSMISCVHPEKSFLNSALSLHGTAPMMSDKCLHQQLAVGHQPVICMRLRVLVGQAESSHGHRFRCSQKDLIDRDSTMLSLAPK